MKGKNGVFGEKKEKERGGGSMSERDREREREKEKGRVVIKKKGEWLTGEKEGVFGEEKGRRER